MRVLFVLDSLGAGGAERSTALLLPLLRDRGLKITVALLRSETEGSEQAVREQGFDVRVLPPGGFVRRIRALRAVIAAVQPDVVHTSIFMADQVGRVASACSSSVVVSSLINVPRLRRFRSDADPPVWKVATVNFIDAITGLLLVDRYHAVTPGVAELYSKAYRISPRRITVVERGRPAAPVEWRSEESRALVRRSIGLSVTDKVVFTAGRQEHQKGHVDLVRAVARIAAQDPRVHLVIAGRAGNASPALLDEIRSTNGASRFVHLLGNRDDVPDLLAAADVMALPSRFEGTAGVVLEALSIGTPIVATELDGMAGILEHEQNALLVRVGDTSAMADAIERLLDDQVFAARLSEASKRAFNARFTLDRSADRMISMYQTEVDRLIRKSAKADRQRCFRRSSPD